MRPFGIKFVVRAVSPCPADDVVDVVGSDGLVVQSISMPLDSMELAELLTEHASTAYVDGYGKGHQEGSCFIEYETYERGYNYGWDRGYETAKEEAIDEL